MNVLLDKIDSREKGSLPISLGTSLAIESLCGLGEFETKKPPIYDFDSLWINVRTLFRNCYGAIEKDVRESIRAEDILHGLSSDILSIFSTMAKESNGRMRVVLYVDSFISFKKVFPNAIKKEPNTDKQKIEHALEEATIKLLLESNYGFEIKQFDCSFTEGDKRTVLLTHYPSDLLSRKQFTELVLLESHTGSIKTRLEWNTKLTNGKQLTRIPFNRLTLQVYGDGNTLFQAMLPSVKKVITELAEKYKWTPATTREKIIFSLEKIKDIQQREFFISLL